MPKRGLVSIALEQGALGTFRNQSSTADLEPLMDGRASGQEPKPFHVGRFTFASS
jgi:hypothetical protein